MKKPELWTKISVWKLSKIVFLWYFFSWILEPFCVLGSFWPPRWYPLPPFSFFVEVRYVSSLPKCRHHDITCEAESTPSTRRITSFKSMSSLSCFEVNITQLGFFMIVPPVFPSQTASRVGFFQNPIMHPKLWVTKSDHSVNGDAMIAPWPCFACTPLPWRRSSFRSWRCARSWRQSTRPPLQRPSSDLSTDRFCLRY